MERTDTGFGECSRCGYTGREELGRSRGMVRVRCGNCGRTEWTKEGEEEQREEEEREPVAYLPPRRPGCPRGGCGGHQVVYRTVGTVRYLRCSVRVCSWRGKGS